MHSIKNEKSLPSFNGIRFKRVWWIFWVKENNSKADYYSCNIFFEMQKKPFVENIVLCMNKRIKKFLQTNCQEMMIKKFQITCLIVQWFAEQQNDICHCQNAPLFYYATMLLRKVKRKHKIIRKIYQLLRDNFQWDCQNRFCCRKYSGAVLLLLLKQTLSHFFPYNDEDTQSCQCHLLPFYK